MRRFSKRAIVDAIGAAFRAPFSSRPAQVARPARRKPLFEQLEPRILLSAEVPIVPPPAQQEPVLSAPLVIGTSPESAQLLAASLHGAAAPHGPRVVQFHDDFASTQLQDEAGDGLVLDFSAVTRGLQFAVAADGSVSVSDGANQVTAAGAVKLVGGGGDDTFRFEKIPDAPLAIETGGRGKDTLDFSAVRDDLTYTTHTDGTLTVARQAASSTWIARYPPSAARAAISSWRKRRRRSRARSMAARSRARRPSFRSPPTSRRSPPPDRW